LVNYPAVGFSFTLRVIGSGAVLQAASGADGSFQEVSGLEAERQLETVQAGGANGRVLQLPSGVKYPNLVLKRGYITSASFLSEWVAQTVTSNLSQPIFTQGLLVALCDADRNPLVVWVASEAWPVKWVTGPLDSMKNEVLTEHLEFTYSSIARVPVGDAGSLAMVGAVYALVG
jgi:phage tail-like protein